MKAEVLAYSIFGPDVCIGILVRVREVLQNLHGQVGQRISEKNRNESSKSDQDAGNKNGTVQVASKLDDARGGQLFPRLLMNKLALSDECGVSGKLN